MPGVQLPVPPGLDVLVDLGVEVDEHGEGDDAEDDEAAPVEVGRVDGGGAERGRLQPQLVVVQVEDLPGDVVGAAVVVHDLGLEEPGGKEGGKCKV